MTETTQATSEEPDAFDREVLAPREQMNDLLHGKDVAIVATVLLHLLDMTSQQAPSVEICLAIARYLDELAVGIRQRSVLNVFQVTSETRPH